MLETTQSDLEKDLDETPTIAKDLEVQRELERILASDSFKGSARCRDFLKHVVYVACSDAHESLKERTIGIAVFGRAPDYDTGTDAIVRVKAGEVRRRLAQYNQSADPGRSIAIELNPGSYTPKITRRAPLPKTVAIPETPPPKQSLSQLLLLGVVAACALALVVGWMLIASSSTPLKRFWRPFLGHDKPLVCTTAPGTYYLSPADLAQRGGDSSEAFSLSKNLQALGRSNRIVIANDTSDADLAVSPSILIGGPKFNHWTQMLTENLRFTFRMVNNVPRIVDRDNPSRGWDDESPSNGKMVEDYVIITRLVATPSHKTVICIAGLKATGTRIGAKFLFKPEFIEQILKFAPEDWDKKNLQIVVRFVPDKQTYTSEPVAATYW